MSSLTRDVKRPKLKPRANASSCHTSSLIFSAPLIFSGSFSLNAPVRVSVCVPFAATTPLSACTPFEVLSCTRYGMVRANDTGARTCPAFCDDVLWYSCAPLVGT